MDDLKLTGPVLMYSLWSKHKAAQMPQSTSICTDLENILLLKICTWWTFDGNTFSHNRKQFLKCNMLVFYFIKSQTWTNTGQISRIHRLDTVLFQSQRWSSSDNFIVVIHPNSVGRLEIDVSPSLSYDSESSPSSCLSCSLNLKTSVLSLQTRELLIACADVIFHTRWDVAVFSFFSCFVLALPLVGSFLWSVLRPYIMVATLDELMSCSCCVVGLSVLTRSKTSKAGMSNSELTQREEEIWRVIKPLAWRTDEHSTSVKSENLLPRN